MNRQPLKSSACNRGVLDNWNLGRITCTRAYPRPLPSHERLVNALCPMKTRLTSTETNSLTWAQVRGLL